MADEISPAKAATRYKIFTKHHRMENGELRFRLMHTDGTGYIRTVGMPESGWQRSHVHAVVVETYVVQSGWMALAELIEHQLNLRIFEAGGIVTTRPGITHNVYLSGDAVIHTIKHGIAEGSDREPGPEGPALDIVTKELDTEPKIWAAALKQAPPVSYNDEYRHFDNLIWQVPAWATAIFAISVQSIMDVFDKPNVQPVYWQWLAVLIFFLAGCIACFALVLARFRIHQRKLKGFSHTPRWKSASTWSQALLTLEAASLAGIASVFLQMQVRWAVGVFSLLAVIGIVGVEHIIRNSKSPERRAG